MNIAMTDYKDRFFDQLIDDIREIKSNHREMSKVLNKTYEGVQQTNGKVAEQERRITALEGGSKKVDIKNLNTWYKDPAVLRILSYLSLALLLLVGAAIKVDIGQFVQ